MPEAGIEPYMPDLIAWKTTGSTAMKDNTEAEATATAMFAALILGGVLQALRGPCMATKTLVVRLAAGALVAMNTDILPTIHRGNLSTPVIDFRCTFSTAVTGQRLPRAGGRNCSPIDSSAFRLSISACPGEGDLQDQYVCHLLTPPKVMGGPRSCRAISVSFGHGKHSQPSPNRTYASPEL